MQWWTDLCGHAMSCCHYVHVSLSFRNDTTPKNCSNNPAFQIAPPWRSPNQALIEKPGIEISSSIKGDCFHHLLLSVSVKVLHLPGTSRPPCNAKSLPARVCRHRLPLLALGSPPPVRPDVVSPFPMSFAHNTYLRIRVRISTINKISYPNHTSSMIGVNPA